MKNMNYAFLQACNQTSMEISGRSYFKLSSLFSRKVFEMKFHPKVLKKFLLHDAVL